MSIWKLSKRLDIIWFIPPGNGPHCTTLPKSPTKILPPRSTFTHTSPYAHPLTQLYTDEIPTRPAPNTLSMPTQHPQTRPTSSRSPPAHHSAHTHATRSVHPFLPARISIHASLSPHRGALTIDWVKQLKQIRRKGRHNKTPLITKWYELKQRLTVLGARVGIEFSTLTGQIMQ